MNLIAKLLNHTLPARTGIRILIVSTGLYGGHAFPGELDVSIRGIESATGQIMVAVLNSEAAFEGEAPAVLSLLVSPRQGELTFSTDALPDGCLLYTSPSPRDS